MPSPTSQLKVVFGTMTFGEEGAEQSRVHDLKDCKAILDIVAAHGHTELDTARMYGFGSSEEYLQKLGVTVPGNPQGFKIATKVFPSARNRNIPAKDKYTFEPEDIELALSRSLQALGTDKIDLYYLHSPDRQVDLKKTLGAINDAHKAGKFERFGVSNYRADEVEEMVRIADENGWVKPSVYQGLYNAITRSAEAELFPVLRKHGISYYAYNPLGGGFFTGAFSKDSTVEKGSRFDPDRAQGQSYRNRYWNDNYFNALDQLRPVAEQHGLTLSEIALRWIVHHSQLKQNLGDAAIIGASSTKHIENNLIDLEKGSLPDPVVQAVENAWELVKPNAPAYHH
ncbi:Aldo/keto reductase [Testicularia cyperi]|uniref:Aldo/keto reductase n=1 Tax=Testicularia cyperi TaxID=1882483 RepID=A0A317XEC9_9BASI|nr:Aldo/keto reductase [Testicularia cyperi]